MCGRNHYVIMNAGCLFDDCATDIKGVMDVWGSGGDQTILVCRRATSRYNGKAGGRIFVSGSGVGYIDKGVELPMRSWYTQDTGMGHKNIEMPLLIENIIDVVDGKIKPRNMVGVTEKRRAWTMK